MAHSSTNSWPWLLWQTVKKTETIYLEAVLQVQPHSLHLSTAETLVHVSWALSAQRYKALLMLRGALLTSGSRVHVTKGSRASLNNTHSHSPQRNLSFPEPSQHSSVLPTSCLAPTPSQMSSSSQQTPWCGPLALNPGKHQNHLLIVCLMYVLKPRPRATTISQGRC